MATVDGRSDQQVTRVQPLDDASRRSGRAGATPPCRSPDPPDYTQCVATKRKAPPAGQGPAEGHRRPAQDRSASRSTRQLRRPGHAAPDLASSGSRARPLDGHQGDRRRSQEVLRHSRRSRASRRKPTTRSSSRSPAAPRRHPPRSSRPAVRTRSATRSSRARHRHRRRRSPLLQQEQGPLRQPEKRDLRVVLTKDKADAHEGQERAPERRHLERRSPRSTRSTTRRRPAGGKLPAQAKGTQDKQLDEAVFSAPRRTSSSARSRPSSATTSSGHRRHAGRPSRRSPQAKATIKQTLQSQNQQKALDLREGLHASAGRTRRSARKGYRTTDCKNGPKADGDADRRRRRRRRAQQRDRRAARGLDTRLRSRERPDIDRRPRRLDDADAPAAARVPVGPRAGRALDRPAHGRGGLRARRRRARAATTRKLLDELGDVLFQVHFLSLLLEERGAGVAGRGRRARARQARPPPPAHLRRGRGRRRRRGAAQLGPDQEDASRGASPASSATCRRTCPGRCTRARCSGAPPRRGFDFGSRALRARCAASWPSSRRRARIASSASTRSATSCSRPSTSPASCRSTRSSRCGPQRADSAGASRPRTELAAADGEDWERSRRRGAAAVLRAGAAEATAGDVTDLGASR